jgi:hypothetical protein
MKIFLFIVFLFAVIAGGFLWYMGMFSPVVIAEREMGPYTYVFVEHTGPYSEVAKPMAELEDQIKLEGFNCIDGIGIYYDNPDKVPQEELRSDVGFIISAEDMDKVKNNKDKFNFENLPEASYLVAEFPIKNNLSYMLGPMRVYPAFDKYIQRKGGVVPEVGVEYYDMTNSKIIFMMPI